MKALNLYKPVSQFKRICKRKSVNFIEIWTSLNIEEQLYPDILRQPNSWAWDKSNLKKEWNKILQYLSKYYSWHLPEHALLALVFILLQVGAQGHSSFLVLNPISKIMWQYKRSVNCLESFVLGVGMEMGWV